MPTGDTIPNRSNNNTHVVPLSNGSLFFSQQKKRPRAEAETSGTMTTPTIQVSDVDIATTSTETIMQNPVHREVEREKEHLTFKLDKLNDKKCRYESHEAFLNKCLSNNLIPNGLKVYVEPSIGNRDEEFLSQWHSRLDEFSRTLTAEVVQYCEKEITKTKSEIETVSNKLKDLVPVPEFSNINKAITANETSRVNELTQRKNRKFYKLKYRHNNTDAGQDRGHRNWDNRREGQPNRWDGSNRRQDFERDREQNSRGQYRDNNWNFREGTDRNTNNNNMNQRDNGRRPGVSYANAARNDRSETSRRPSFRHLQTPQINNEVPLHERVSLHRRNSRRNVTRSGGRDQEIEELRKRLQQLENDPPEQVLNHIVNNDPTRTKNMETAQRKEMGQNISDITEMKTFLAGVMETISAFDKQLTNQLNTGPTRSERS